MAWKCPVMAPFTRTTQRAPATGADTAPTALDPGGARVLGRYRLHRPIGAGGFGSVWLARDERLERDVAVKVLPRDRVIGGRFEREARAAARLSHPAIVTLYEAAVDDDAAYLVSEFVRGATFGQLLEDGRLSDLDVVTVGIAVCDALAHAHSHGVVHRDVKPSNVLIPEQPPSPAQLAKLTDFGVARLIGGNPLTRTGDVVGTAAYMAPEQAEGRQAEAPADLYSLALVLYEALTGINPIEASGAAGRARRLGAHLPPLRRYRRDLPRELGCAVDLALRPRPSERGTVAELHASLVETQALVDDEPGVVGGPWPTLAGLTRSRSEREAEAPPPQRSGWPERLPGGAAAALIAAWLVALAFHSPPVVLAAAALIGGLAVWALPRIGWVSLALTGSIALVAAGRSGAAAVVLIALLVPVIVLLGAPTRWPLGAAAPALGAVLLAGAWPALAGRDRRIWRRAALGAVGWVWLFVVDLLAGSGVYTTLPPGIPPRALWMGSVDHALGHALWPLVRAGALAPALVWAAAAAVLPWIVRGPARVRLVVVVIWSAALASATTTTLRTLHTGVTVAPAAVVIGAVAGGVVALAPTLLTRRQDALASSDTVAGLA